jgi:hypothetical protein
MCAHILNISIAKKTARRIRLSPHDSGTVKASRTILVPLSSFTAHTSVSAHLNAHMHTFTHCEQQRELRWKCSEMEKYGGGGGTF